MGPDDKKMIRIGVIGIDVGRTMLDGLRGMEAALRDRGVVVVYTDQTDSILEQMQQMAGNCDVNTLHLATAPTLDERVVESNLPLQGCRRFDMGMYEDLPDPRLNEKADAPPKCAWTPPKIGRNGKRSKSKGRW